MRSVLHGLRGIWGRQRAERDMQEEMRLHLEAATERLMARGLPLSDARAAARREFGNVPALQEEGRDARGGHLFVDMLADTRFAWRHFRRTRLTTAIIIVVLSLGLGSTTALIAFGQAMLLRPPPGVTRDPGVVRVYGTMKFPAMSRDNYPRDMSWQEFRDLASHHELFAQVAAWNAASLPVSFGGSAVDAEMATVEFATPELLPLLGATPSVGRFLPPGDDLRASSLEAVISHAVWQRRFGGVSDIIGRRMLVNGFDVRIIGVSATRFRGVDDHGSDERLWMPFSARNTLLGTSGVAFTSRDSAMVRMVARLAPRLSFAAAASAVHGIGARNGALMAPVPGVISRGMELRHLGGDQDLQASGDFARVVALFGFGTLLILLVVCTNASALLVGSGINRRQEIAVRLSLGASRSRIVRQLVTEGVWLTLVASGLGALVCLALLCVFGGRIDSSIDLRVDTGTMLFTGLCALLTGVIFSLSPALHVTRSGSGDVLRSASAAGGRTRLQRGFLVAQIALTQPLLVGLAMLVVLMSSSWGTSTDLAAQDHVLQILVPVVPGSDSTTTRARLTAAMERLRIHPGITGLVADAGRNGINGYDVLVEGSASSARSFRVEEHPVVPGYLALMGIGVIQGRDVAWADTLTADDEIVIDRDFASRAFGNANPLGRRFNLGIRRGVEYHATVVGIIADRRASGRPDRMGVFAIARRRMRDDFLVGTTAPAEMSQPGIQAILRQEAPGIPFRFRSLGDVARTQRRELLEITAAIAMGGILALGLASLGLYGLVSMLVSQRRREIGIRLAIGAPPAAVAGVLIRTGVGLAALGLTLGLPLSLLGLRLLSSQPDMPKVDPLSIGMFIVVSVMGVASLASGLPARQAARIDPMRVLRGE